MRLTVTCGLGPVGTVKQLNKTLDNYLKLVERNIGALQCVRKDRPVFLTLGDFLEWLLQQTGQLQEKCRSKCMSALSYVCRSLPGMEITYVDGACIILVIQKRYRRNTKNREKFLSSKFRILTFQIPNSKFQNERTQ